MKVISIVYQAKQDPKRISVVGGIFENIDKAQQHCAIAVSNTFKGIEWIPVVTNQVELDPYIKSLSLPKREIAKSTVQVSLQRGKENQNWLMKTIIHNKDLDLYQVSKKYLSKVENLYLEEQLK